MKTSRDQKPVVLPHGTPPALGGLSVQCHGEWLFSNVCLCISNTLRWASFGDKTFSPLLDRLLEECLMLTKRSLPSSLSIQSQARWSSYVGFNPD